MTSNGTYPKWKNKDKIEFGSKAEMANIEYKYIINNEQVSHSNSIYLFSSKPLGRTATIVGWIYPNISKVAKQ